MTASFELDRFIAAQDPVYEQVCVELGNGRKVSHWMWYIFPQISGLGRSETAQKFAIVSAKEAAAYLAHPILGPRLVECTQLALSVPGKSARDIFAHDDVKFHSSMTLFAQVEGVESCFAKALDRFFSGERDQATLGRL